MEKEELTQPEYTEPILTNPVNEETTQELSEKKLLCEGKEDYQGINIDVRSDRNNFERDMSYNALRERYRSGKIKLTEAEMDLVRFCHGRDMKAFLREEFEKHPIVLDEAGNLVGGNPFEKERRERLAQQDPQQMLYS